MVGNETGKIGKVKATRSLTKYVSLKTINGWEASEKI